MKPRSINDQVRWMGAVDWNRRLFDALIPLPDGTSYNAYLVQGSTHTALLDTADPTKTDVLMAQLKDVQRLDYLVAHHAEQDHSGSIPAVLEKYPACKVMATPKAKGMLVDLLRVAPDRILEANDGDRLSLGSLNLQFLHTPWVHWPETMCSYVPETKMLFSCDFFGSHLATTDLFVRDRARVYEAAKRYYAEIMMPFRKVIQKHLDRLAHMDIQLIAPSHGPVYDDPAFMLDAYADWVNETPKNEVVLPYISMHGSTEKMVQHLVGELAQRGVTVHLFDLAVTDLGKLAITLVDAATVVVGTPTVHIGPHPHVFAACHLTNALRPKLRFAAIVGSYGWSTKAIDQIAALIPNLKVDILDPVLCKGDPRDDTFRALDRLADTIAERHASL